MRISLLNTYVAFLVLNFMKPDIVIIKFSNSFTLPMKPVCLPTNPIKNDHVCLVSGWGETKTIKSPKFERYLNAVHIKISSHNRHNDCKEILKTFMPKYDLCTRPSWESGCRGDSGGPVVCNGNLENHLKISSKINQFLEDGKAVLHGIVSYGLKILPCNVQPSGLVNVYSVIGFIQDVLVMLKDFRNFPAFEMSIFFSEKWRSNTSLLSIIF